MTARLPRITAAQLLRALHRDGWQEHRRSHGHVQLKHQSRPGRVTIPVHPGLIIKPKTLSRALEQAGLTIAELRELL